MGTASLSGDVDLQRRCWAVSGVGWASMAGHGQISDGSRMRPGFEGSDGEARRLGLAWMRGVGDWMMHGLKAASRPWALGGAAGQRRVMSLWRRRRRCFGSSDGKAASIH
ncbi:hypothetical protein M0R45_000470 [Rubus argutus]|uniref:Uncharacterized protein n=1 Tax=Rubus argutus TaxID=59490 RepID=A0AAW1VPB1_RUBAR